MRTSGERNDEQQGKDMLRQPVMTYMLPVAELLSVGKEPLERSICANLRVGKKKNKLISD